MFIPRPSDSIDMLIRNESTVGYEDEKEEIPQVKQNNPPSDKEDNLNRDKADESEQKDENDKNLNNQDLDEGQIIEDKNNEVTVQDESSQESDEDSDYNNQDLSEETSKGYTCNICKDPKCPRQKGDLRIYCIHYKENKDKNKDNKDK